MTKEAFEKKAISYIRAHGLISPGDKVIVGLSGGADSVCLLLLLDNIRESLGCTLFAVHVEHGIRGEDSLCDERFSRQLCERLGIGCEVFHCDVPALSDELRMGLEEAARIARYEAYEKAARDDNTVIALAHHAIDQAETVLFNMSRGSGIRGLSGMAPRRDIYIRPILWATKPQIEEYVRACDETWVTDASNFDEGYSRNRIRHSVIPALEKAHPGAALNIAFLADILRDIAEHLDNEVRLFEKDNISEGAAGELYVEIDTLLALDKAPENLVVLDLIRKKAQSAKNIGAVHIGSVNELIASQSGSSVDLPYGVRVYKEGSRLCFTAREDHIGARPGKGSALPDAVREEILVDIDDIPTEARLGGYAFSFSNVTNLTEKEIKADNLCTKFIKCDRIHERISLRYGSSSDSIVTDKSGSHKKLGRFFMDKKIPAAQRSLIPVLAVGNDIILVAGHIGRLGYDYRVDDDTKNILKVDIKQIRESDDDRKYISTDTGG